MKRVLIGYRNVGMILASRDDLTSEENQQCHAALKSEVRKAGYGYIEGRYVDETSLLVVGRKGDDGGALLGYLKNLGIFRSSRQAVVNTVSLSRSHRTSSLWQKNLIAPRKYH